MVIWLIGYLNFKKKLKFKLSQKGVFSKIETEKQIFQ